MEIKALESTKSKIVFELEGAGHTFCNLLVQELWKDNDIKVAAYNISHPLTGKPKVTVEGKDVKKSLKDAVKSLKKEIKKFKESVKSA